LPIYKAPVIRLVLFFDPCTIRLHFFDGDLTLIFYTNLFENYTYLK
jgi:hypothetical protein